MQDAAKTAVAQIAILGGGLQGCCVALELARQDMDVILIEQDHLLMNRASFRNEGKIHLGLVYANDPTMETAILQLKGALSFGVLLHRWTGCSAADLGLSTPFNYLVANDSLLSIIDLTDHYDRLTETYLDYTSRVPGSNYLGTRPTTLATLLDFATLAGSHHPDYFSGGFATPELAIDTGKLCELIRNAVAREDRIRTFCSVRVEGVVRNGGFLDIEGCGAGIHRQFKADQVVNATWANRLAIDSTLGLKIERGWVHRLKYRVLTRLPHSLRNAPSVTVVNGRYGDVVVRPDSTACLSWYPVAMCGWSHDLSPPQAWDRGCSEKAEHERAGKLAKEVIDSIADWYPEMQAGEQLSVDAGVIFAHGRTDVDDPNSELHRRTRIGVSSFDGYHSVNPGKLTTAPLVAISAAHRIMGKDANDLGSVAELVH